MKYQIELTRGQINNSALVPRTADPLTGATVVFVGTAREITGQRQTDSLEYEAFDEMARQCLDQLAEQASWQWPIKQLRIVHRLGRVELGETCVAIVVSCPHRAEAFAAASWLMEQTKRLVPIWKKEILASGNSQWVHPTTDERRSSATSSSDLP